jgi:hypothetical protein
MSTRGYCSRLRRAADAQRSAEDAPSAARRGLILCIRRHSQRQAGPRSGVRASGWGAKDSRQSGRSRSRRPKPMPPVPLGRRGKCHRPWRWRNSATLHRFCNSCAPSRLPRISGRQSPLRGEWRWRWPGGRRRRWLFLSSRPSLARDADDELGYARGFAPEPRHSRALRYCWDCAGTNVRALGTSVARRRSRGGIEAGLVLLGSSGRRAARS